MRRAGIVGLALSLVLGTFHFMPSARAATLVMTFDPANSSSYSGSGTTLTDITSSITGTMSNVGYLASTNCGVFNFTGNSRVSFNSYNFGNQFSLSTWVKPSATDPYSIQTIMSNAAANLATNGFKIEWNSWNTRDKIMILESGNGTTGNTTTSTTGVMVNDAWQHVVYTFDKSSGAVTLYRNGSAVTTNGNLLPSNINTNATWWLGAMGGNSYWMNAQMGVTKIYSTVLTSAEVTSDYNSSSGRYAATPSCPAPAAPSNSVAPTISGTTTFGSVLTATSGTWSGSPTYGYQWQRASSTGGSYSNISGATSSTYTLVAADVGQYLKVNVTATNGGGSTTALSSATAQIGKANQTTLTLGLSASSKTYPYSQALTLTPSGGTGTGATTFAVVAGGTATDCALSSSSSPATLTASSSGTCLIQATKASDSNYNAATSASQTFTFSKGSNSLSFAITSYSARFGESVTVTASGVGSGAITYSKGASTACDVNASTGVVTVTASSGSCAISASIATDVNYLTASSSNSASVTVSQGLTSATISFASGDLVFRTAKTITVVASVAGKVTFQASGKRIPGCINKSSNAGNSYTVTCSYKPSIRNSVRITVTLNPTSSSYLGNVTESALFQVRPRSGTR